VFDWTGLVHTKLRPEPNDREGVPFDLILLVKQLAEHGTGLCLEPLENGNLL
jgi:hypothetical protein